MQRSGDESNVKLQIEKDSYNERERDRERERVRASVCGGKEIRQKSDQGMICATMLPIQLG